MTVFGAFYSTKYELRIVRKKNKHPRGIKVELKTHAALTTLDSYCFIQCTQSNACNAAQINYPRPQNLAMECNGYYSCKSLHLSGPGVGTTVTQNHYNASIYCHGDLRACSNAVFDLDTLTNNAWLICHGCESTTILANYARVVSLQCIKDSCQWIRLHVTNVTDNIYILCDGYC